MTPSHYAIRVAGMYGALFLVYGLQLPYLGVWLTARGLSPVEIGIVSSLPLMVRLFANPVIAMMADASGRHARLVFLLAAVAVTGAALLPVAHGALAIALGVTVMLVALQSSLPLIEVVAMRGVRAFGLDYGRLRLWGSITFIVATIVGGAVIERAGAESFVWMVLLSVLANVVAASVLPASTGANATRTAEPVRGALRPSDLRPIVTLLTQPAFAIFLVGTAANQASHATYYAFSAVHWRAIGMSGDWIGILWGIGVVAEIVLFAMSGRIVARLGPEGLLLLGGLGGVVRWTAMAFDPTGPVLVVLQLLHAATFGATHLGAVHFIAARVPEHQAGLAQTLSATFSTGVATALALVAAGVLYEAYAEASYMAMAALSVIGCVAAWATPRKT